MGELLDAVSCGQVVVGNLQGTEHWQAAWGQREGGWVIFLHG